MPLAQPGELRCQCRGAGQCLLRAETVKLDSDDDPLLHSDIWCVTEPRGPRGLEPEGLPDALLRSWIAAERALRSRLRKAIVMAEGRLRASEAREARVREGLGRQGRLGL